MASNQNIKFFHYASKEQIDGIASKVVGGIYFAKDVQTLYVWNGTALEPYGAGGISDVTFEDSGTGTPTGGVLTIIMADGSTKTVNGIASVEDLSVLAEAFQDAIEALNMDEVALNEATISAASGSDNGSATISTKILKQEDGKVTNADGDEIVIKAGDNIKITEGTNGEIVINGESGDLAKGDGINITESGDVKTISVNAGNGLEFEASAAEGASKKLQVKVVAQNGLSVGESGIAMALGTDTTAGAVSVSAGNGLSISNGAISMDVASTSTAGAVKIGNGIAVGTDGTISADYSSLTGDADIATNNDGVVTLKAGVIETNGVIANSTGTDITLAKVATTGKASDVTVTYTGGTTETTVQGAITNIDARIDNLEKLPTYDVVVLTEVGTGAPTTTASEATMHKIYLKKQKAEDTSYDEWITIKTGESTYSWEKLGNTSVDLDGYVKSIQINNKTYVTETNGDKTLVVLPNVINAISAEDAISSGDSDLVAVSVTTGAAADGIITATLSSTVKTQSISTATAATDGLATAADVKDYVDSAVAAETTRATGVEGTLSSLTTTEKGSLVGAINEVNGKIDTEIADLKVDAFSQASVTSGSGSPANSAVIKINGISETDGKIATDSNSTATNITIKGGSGIGVAVSDNTITVSADALCWETWGENE